MAIVVTCATWKAIERDITMRPYSMVEYESIRCASTAEYELSRETVTLPMSIFMRGIRTWSKNAKPLSVPLYLIDG